MEKEANPKLERKKKKALELSIIEGATASASRGVSATYITPFALKLAAQPIHIGIISSLSSLLSPLAQLKGSRLMEKYHRKSITTKAIFLQAIIWIPISILAILAWLNVKVNYLLYMLIILYTISVCLNGLAYPSWFSWMGDLVSSKEKGKYFSRRRRIIGIVDLMTALVAVTFLQTLTNKNLAFIGFAILFFFAFIFRFMSFTLLKKQYSPHFRPRKSYKIKWKKFLKDDKNFKRFSIYQMLFHFSVMIASPFFAVYMLKELNFSYMTFIFVGLSATAYYILFMPWIGKISDKYGNIKLLYISNAGFILAPLLWIVIKKPLLLILLPQLISGLANAAFIIAFTNFTYDALSEEKRGAGVAYVNLLVGVGSFFGSLIGGILLNYINITFMGKFLFVFALASAMRFLVAIFYLPRLKEERRFGRAPVYLSMIVHPLRTIQHEVTHYVLPSKYTKFKKLNHAK